MKKFVCFAVAFAFAFSGALCAQDLSNILGSLSKVVYGYVGTNDVVSLPGNWTYTTPAISLESDDSVAGLAGSAVSAAAETKVSDYLTKVGITAGSVRFTFNDDLTFVCYVKGIPLSGTWRTDGTSSEILSLQFGQTLKYLSLTGTVKNTLEGCAMTFNGTKFLKFLKKALEYVGTQNSTAASVSSLAGNYSKMQIGFNLKRD